MTTQSSSLEKGSKSTPVISPMSPCRILFTTARAKYPVVVAEGEFKKGQSSLAPTLLAGDGPSSSAFPPLALRSYIKKINIDTSLKLELHVNVLK